MAQPATTRFGRYQLLERLASGGMAELFKAKIVGPHGFQKTVVIEKILSHLATDAYFGAAQREFFFPEVGIVFRVGSGTQHYHVPLLLSPFGFTTYRGS